ncbi:MAG: patatin-like phospholipase family protein [Acidimicrobiales bacterium]
MVSIPFLPSLWSAGSGRGPQASPHRRGTALALGGGGMFGMGYDLGVAHGLRDGGIDLDRAPSIATSAGVWAASALALDVGFETFDALEAPTVPNLQSGVLADIARDLFGEARSPLVRATVVSLRTGRRRLLDGRHHALADLCAASSAVPGLLPPHTVGGVTYVDGGVRSNTAVDIAPRADHLIVITPLAGQTIFPVGRAQEVLLAAETRLYKRRNPGADVTVIRPNRQIAAMAGTNPMNLFDADLGRAVYPLAVEQGRRRADRLVERDLAA